MRGLTIRQPWAELIRRGIKTIETRGWRTDWRGDVLIHAGKRRPPAFAPAPWNANLPGLDLDNWFDGWESDDGAWWCCDYRWSRMPLGAVVAVARLADCVPIRESTDPPESWRDDSEPQPWLGVSGDTLFLYERPLLWGSGGRYMSPEYPLGDFSPGRWAWLLTDVRPLSKPVFDVAHVLADGRVKPGGALHMWEPTEDLVRAVATHLGG